MSDRDPLASMKSRLSALQADEIAALRSRLAAAESRALALQAERDDLDAALKGSQEAFAASVEDDNGKIAALQADLDAAREALIKIANERYTGQILMEDDASPEEQIKAWSRDSISRQDIARRALSPVPSPEPRESPETSGSVHVDNSEGWRRT